MSLKYAVIGTGAIGGYYGGMLAKAGKDVHFLLHSDYEYVKEHGLRIDSVGGNFHLRDLNVYRQAEDMPLSDVVLVCLKSTNNTLLKDLLPPLLQDNTLVILVQNGLGLEADLAKEFPALKNIAGAMAFICSNKIGFGHIAHLDQGALNLGLYKGDIELLEHVNADLSEAAIKSQVVDLEPARWKKLVWNIPYNGMTVVLNTTTDNLMKYAASRQLIHELMLEVISAANKVGEGKFSVPENFADMMMDTTDKMTPYSPSMKLDYDNKRVLEIEYIYSRPVAEAFNVGFNMSKVSMLERQLQFIQSKYLKA